MHDIVIYFLVDALLDRVLSVSERVFLARCLTRTISEFSIAMHKASPVFHDVLSLLLLLLGVSEALPGLDWNLSRLSMS